MSALPVAEPFGIAQAYRFRPPRHASRATRWARGWRRRWFTACGTVAEDHASRELLCLYSESADPAPRLALLDELAGHPRGVGQVLAACREHKRRQELGLIAAAAGLPNRG